MTIKTGNNRIKIPMTEMSDSLSAEISHETFKFLARLDDDRFCSP